MESTYRLLIVLHIRYAKIVKLINIKKFIFINFFTIFEF
jgi:hypothetical protein